MRHNRLRAARLALLDGEGAEAAQFDPRTARQGLRDLVEDGGDDALHVAVEEMRVQLADALNQL